MRENTRIVLCGSPWSYFRYVRVLYESCTISKDDRQKAAVARLEQSEILLKYKSNELERKIADLETQKQQCIRLRKASDARALVLEKHRLQTRLNKERAILQFTQNLIAKIEDQQTMRETMSSLKSSTSLPTRSTCR